jgi:RNA polymerase sigma factor (sigma-70 family)
MCFSMLLNGLLKLLGIESLLTPADWAKKLRAVAESRDQLAFTDLFDHFAPRIEAYLMRLGADAASAEEISQDVMVTMWRKAHLFDFSKSSVGTWLYRIARNRRIDLLRRNKVDFVDPMDQSFEGVADDQAADEGIDIQRREEILRAAIADLPPEQFELVKLAFFQALTHSAIAEKTGLPLGTVKSRIRLAFSRLRRNLDAQGIVDAN